MDAYKNAPVDYELFTMKMNVNQTRLELPFLEQFSGMREWIGDRQAKNLSSKKITYTEKAFEETVDVPRRDIETDQFGLYTPIVSQMGFAAGDEAGKQAFTALVTNDTWIDGVNFYSTSRTYGSNTISNLTTSALSETTFNAAYLAMSSYRAHNDKALRSRPNVLICGPKLRTTAWNILKNQFNYDGTDKVQIENVNKDVVDLVIHDELVGDYDDYWFLMNTREMIKPVFQNDPKSVTLVRKDKEDDDNVFERNMFRYGTSRYLATGKTFPHLVYAGIVS